MRKKKSYVWPCVAAVAAMLSACGSGPNESDVREALIRQGDAMGVSKIDSGFKANIAKVKLIGCAKTEPSGYKCDISNAAGAVANARFVKTDTGWSVVN